MALVTRLFGFDKRAGLTDSPHRWCVEHVNTFVRLCCGRVDAGSKNHNGCRQSQRKRNPPSLYLRLPVVALFDVEYRLRFARQIIKWLL